VGVLLAPNDLRPSASQAKASPSAREETALTYGLIVLVMALSTYTLVAGFGLLQGSVEAKRAYLLMTPVPILLALWYGYGALRARFLELGLLLLCGGWGMVFLTLLLKHAGVQSALAQGLTLSQASDSAWVWICAALSLALLGTGALLCIMRWRSELPAS